MAKKKSETPLAKLPPLPKELRGWGEVRRRSYQYEGETRYSSTLSIRYYVKGKRVEESVGHRGFGDAVSLLLKRREQHDAGFAVADAKKITFENAVRFVETDYKANRRDSWLTAAAAFKRLAVSFAGKRLIAIDERAILDHRDLQINEDYSVPTVNQDMRMLRRALKLAMRRGLLARVPHFELLDEKKSIRQGWFDQEDFKKLVDHLPEEIRNAVWAMYLTGWRLNAILSREWKHVDFKNKCLILDPKAAKNDEGLTFYYGGYPALREIIEHQLKLKTEVEELMRMPVKYLFFRVITIGKRTWPAKCTHKRIFYEAWHAAVKAAGLPDERIPHDLRRTAVRNMAEAGIDRETAMKMVGLKTESMHRRYNIQDKGSLVRGSELIGAFHSK